MHHSCILIPLLRVSRAVAFTFFFFLPLGAFLFDYGHGVIQQTVLQTAKRKTDSFLGENFQFHMGMYDY